MTLIFEDEQADREQPIVDQQPVDPADIAELMSWLNELTFADTYNGFTTLKWIRRRPYAAIDNLNAAMERRTGSTDECSN